MSSSPATARHFATLTQQTTAVRAVTAGFILALIIFLLVSAMTVHPEPQPKDLRTHDVGVYFGMAKARVFSVEMLGGHRPPTVPLVYKAFRNDPHAIATFQHAFWFLAWAFLACATFATSQSKALGLLVALTYFFFSKILGQYNDWLMSESISMSLLVCCIAGVILASRYRSAGLAVLCFFLPAYALARDTNAWVVGAAGIFYGLYYIKKLSVRRAFLAVFCIALFFISSWSARQHHRHAGPMMNVLFQRIAGDPAAIEWFKFRGLPDITEYKGTYAWSNNRAAFTNQKLVDWLRESGKPAIIKFLLIHPGYTIRNLVKDRFEIYPFRIIPLFTIGTCFLIALMIPGRAPLLLFLLAGVHAVVAYHGDSHDVLRHCSQIPIQLWTASLQSCLEVRNSS